jgi:hypothetical protein
MWVPQNANPPTSPTSSEPRQLRPASEKSMSPVPRNTSGHHPRSGNAAALIGPDSAAAKTATHSGDG